MARQGAAPPSSLRREILPDDISSSEANYGQSDFVPDSQEHQPPALDVWQAHWPYENEFTHPTLVSKGRSQPVSPHNDLDSRSDDVGTSNFVAKRPPSAGDHAVGFAFQTFNRTADGGRKPAPKALEPPPSNQSASKAAPCRMRVGPNVVINEMQHPHVEPELKAACTPTTLLPITVAETEQQAEELPRPIVDPAEGDDAIDDHVHSSLLTKKGDAEDEQSHLAHNSEKYAATTAQENVLYDEPQIAREATHMDEPLRDTAQPLHEQPMAKCPDANLAASHATDSDLIWIKRTVRKRRPKARTGEKKPRKHRSRSMSHRPAAAHSHGQQAQSTSIELQHQPPNKELEDRSGEGPHGDLANMDLGDPKVVQHRSPPDEPHAGMINLPALALSKRSDLHVEQQLTSAPLEEVTSHAVESSTSAEPDTHAVRNVQSSIPDVCEQSTAPMIQDAPIPSNAQGTAVPIYDKAELDQAATAQHQVRDITVAQAHDVDATPPPRYPTIAPPELEPPTGTPAQPSSPPTVTSPMNEDLRMHKQATRTPAIANIPSSIDDHDTQRTREKTYDFDNQLHGVANSHTPPRVAKPPPRSKPTSGAKHRGKHGTVSSLPSEQMLLVYLEKRNEEDQARAERAAATVSSSEKYVAENGQLQRKVGRLSSELETANKSITSLSNESDARGSEIDKLRVKVGKVDSFKKFLNGLGNDLEKLQDGQESLSAKMAMLNQEAAEIKKQQESVTHSVVTALTEYGDSRDAIRNFVENAKSQISNLKETGTWLRGELDKRDGELQKAFAREKDWQACMNELISHFERHGEAITSSGASFNSKLDKLLSTVDCIAANGSSVLPELTALQNSLARIQTKVEASATSDDTSELQSALSGLAKDTFREQDTQSTQMGVELLKSVETRLVECMSSLEQKIASESTAQERLESAQQDKERLYEQIDEEKKNVSALREELEQAAQSLQTAESDARLQLAESQKAFNQSEQDKKRFEDLLQKSRGDLQILRAEVDSCKIDLSTKERDLKIASDEGTKHLSKIAELEAAQAEMNADQPTILTLRKDLEAARDDARACEAKLQSAQSQLCGMQLQYDKLQAQLEGAQNVESELSAKVKKHEETVGSLETELATLQQVKAENASLATQVDELRTTAMQVPDLRNEVSGLKKDLELANAEAGKSRSAAEASSAEKSELKTSCDELEKEVTKLKSDLQQQHGRMKEAADRKLSAERERASREAAELQQRLEAMKSGKHEAEQALTAKSALLNEMQEKHNLELGSQSTRAAELEAAKLNAQAELETVRQEFETQKRTSEEASTRELSELRQRMQADSEAASQASDRKIATLAAEHKERLVQLRTAHQNEHAAVEKRAVTAEGHVIELTKKCAMLESESLSQSRERTALESRAQHAEKEMARLTGQIASIGAMSQQSVSQTNKAPVTTNPAKLLVSNVNGHDPASQPGAAPQAVQPMASQMLPPSSTLNKARRKVDQSAPQASLNDARPTASSTQVMVQEDPDVDVLIRQEQVVFMEAETQDFLNSDLGASQNLNDGVLASKNEDIAVQDGTIQSFAAFNRTLDVQSVEADALARESSPLTDLDEFLNFSEDEEHEPEQQGKTASMSPGGAPAKGVVQANTASKMAPVHPLRERDNHQLRSNARQPPPRTPTFPNLKASHRTVENGSSPDYMHHNDGGAHKQKEYHAGSRPSSRTALEPSKVLSGRNSRGNGSRDSAFTFRKAAAKHAREEHEGDADHESKRRKEFHDLGKRPEVPGTAAKKLYIPSSGRSTTPTPTPVSRGSISRMRSSAPGSQASGSQRKRSNGHGDRYSDRFDQELS